MADFIQFARARWPEDILEEDVIEWAGGLSNWEFYNSTALQIARMYHRKELNYPFCDSVMNDLWRQVRDGLRSGQPVPEPFYEIYLAFDAGEYHRKADKSDNPITEFTDPWIAELVIRFGL